MSKKSKYTKAQIGSMIRGHIAYMESMMPKKSKTARAAATSIRRKMRKHLK